MDNIRHLRTEDCGERSVFISTGSGCLAMQRISIMESVSASTRELLLTMRSLFHIFIKPSIVDHILLRSRWDGMQKKASLLNRWQWNSIRDYRPRPRKSTEASNKTDLWPVSPKWICKHVLSLQCAVSGEFHWKDCMSHLKP